MRDQPENARSPERPGTGPDPNRPRSTLRRPFQWLKERRQKERSAGVYPQAEEGGGSGGFELFDGYKTAHLEIFESDDGELTNGRFVSLAYEVPYAVRSTARCARKKHHQAPDERCSCGLHALTDRGDILSGRYAGATLSTHTAVLRVAMWGTIIESTVGYKASNQAVQKVELSPLCGESHCGERAAGYEIAEDPADLDVGGVWKRVEARCMKHQRGRMLTAGEIAGIFEVDSHPGDESEWREALEARERERTWQIKLVSAAAGIMVLLGAWAWALSSEWKPAANMETVAVGLLVGAAFGAICGPGWVPQLRRRVTRDQIAGIVFSALLISMVLMAIAGRGQTPSEIHLGPEPKLTETQAYITKLRLGERRSATTEGVIRELQHLYGIEATAGPVGEGDGVQVILAGDRILLAAAGENCQHWGLNLKEELIWETEGPRAGRGCSADGAGIGSEDGRGGGSSGEGAGGDA